MSYRAFESAEERYETLPSWLQVWTGPRLFWDLNKSQFIGAITFSVPKTTDSIVMSWGGNYFVNSSEISLGLAWLLRNSFWLAPFAFGPFSKLLNPSCWLIEWQLEPCFVHQLFHETNQSHKHLQNFWADAQIFGRAPTSKFWARPDWARWISASKLSVGRFWALWDH